MKFQKLTSLLLCAILLACTGLNAAEEAKKSSILDSKSLDALKKQVAEKINADTLLAWIPDVVATYGDNKKITGDQVRKLIKPNLEAALKQGMSVKDISIDQLKSFSRFLVENLIASDLLANLASKEGIVADTKAILQQMEGFKKQVGEEAFKAQIKESGVSEKELVDKMAQMQQINKYIMNKVVITDAELKARYDSYGPTAFTNLKASHILAMFPEANTGKEPTEADKKKAMEKITAAKKALESGKAFADVAKEFSDCPSKEQGGDLGTFHPGDMVPEFEKALDGMKAGEIKGPVETKFGYHIIKAGEKSITPFEQAKEGLKQELTQQKAGQIYNELSSKLLAESNVKHFIEAPKQQPDAAPATK